MKLVEAMLRGVSVALVGITMCDSHLAIVCILYRWACMVLPIRLLSACPLSDISGASWRLMIMIIHAVLNGIA